MLNLAYISWSSDFEIFLINLICFHLFIELYFEINLQIILSKTKQARHYSEEFLFLLTVMFLFSAQKELSSLSTMQPEAQGMLTSHLPSLSLGLIPGSTGTGLGMGVGYCMIISMYGLGGGVTNFY